MAEMNGSGKARTVEAGVEQLVVEAGASRPVVSERSCPAQKHAPAPAMTTTWPPTWRRGAGRRQVHLRGGHGTAGTASVWAKSVPS
ncbi:MAG: hypothetical protein M0Z40_18785 [Actinomycetota bacterium]|jgi:hypothetical protein|nr:hypothetical protein [Actinomycetota bacterium]MDA8077228.1 hypothetical protein [Actinomycetota bacterium]